MKMTRFALVLLITFVLTACTAQASSVTPCPTSVTSNASACALPSKTPPALPAGALFQVLLSDGKVVPFSAADLKPLSAVPVALDGKPREAYRLLDVLSAAGARDFAQLTFNGEITLTVLKAKVDDSAVVVIGENARLVLPSLPAEQQGKPFTTLRVK